MSINNVKKVGSLKNKVRGRRVFILANGPSILKENLKCLENEIVIGMNASTILEEQFGIFSQYYVCSDARFLMHPDKSKYAKQLLHADCIRVLRADLQSHDDLNYQDRTMYINPLKRDGFSKDLTVGYNYGCTTTMLALQLAYYLGAKEIYLLGVDLKYSADQPRFYEEKDFQIDDSFTSIQMYNILNARDVLKSQNIALYNCSEFSYLRPYMGYEPFSSLFAELEAVV